MAAGALWLALFIAQSAAVQATPEARAGERVALTLFEQGSRVRGTLVKMTSDTVALDVRGREVNVPLSRIRRIEVGGDSLLNGSLIGAAVLGVYCAFVCGQGLPSERSLPGAVLSVAGIGALVGAAFDGASSDRRIVYEAGRHPVARQEVRPQLKISIRF